MVYYYYKTNNKKLESALNYYFFNLDLFNFKLLFFYCTILGILQTADHRRVHHRRRDLRGVRSRAPAQLHSDRWHQGGVGRHARA